MKRSSCLLAFLPLALLLFVAPIVGASSTAVAAPSQSLMTTTTLSVDSPLAQPSPDYVDPITLLSPPTTIPDPSLQKPPGEIQPTVVLYTRGIAPDGSDSKRYEIDTKTGGVVGVGLPGHEIVPVNREDGEVKTALAWGLNVADHVVIRDIDQNNVYKVETDVWICPEQTGDYDTWAFGERGATGYVWFSALQVSIGSDYNEDLATFHVGLVMGGGDDCISNQWHGSFGGYYGADSGGSGVYGDSPLGVTNYFDTDTWYTLRISRVSQQGSTWTWGGYITNKSTNIVTCLGYFQIPYGSMASNAMYWTEIDEQDPETTDFVGNHDLNCMYQRLGIGFPEAFYNGHIGYSETDVENTDVRCIRTADRYTISDRECERLHVGTLWQY